MSSQTPILVRFGVPQTNQLEPPQTSYDVESETSDYDPKDRVAVVWATGSEITKANLDPTRDEQTDR